METSKPRENYATPPGTNGDFGGHAVMEKKTGKPLSAYHSDSFGKAAHERTEYDKYWLMFYNQKAANFKTDLLKLEFL